VVLEQFEFIGSYSKKSDIFTLFSLFSAGGGNGIQLIFSSDEFAFCTKTYACHFCFFLNFNITLTLNLIVIAFLSIFCDS